VVGSKGLLDFDGYTHLDLATDGTWQRVWEQPGFDLLDPMDPIRLESYAAQNQAFIDSILEGRPPPVTGEDGRAAVELCQASLLSARSGQAIKLPL
jgi:myo-inositol 2-dehydrogenase/D-chiro-inositol 1-dehydrogenase